MPDSTQSDDDVQTADEPTATYEVVSGRHYARGSVYRQGDQIELTADEYRGLEFRFKRVDGGSGAPGSAGAETVAEQSTVETAEFENILAQTVDEIEEAVDAGDYDDLLVDLKEYEQANQKRVGVERAINSRLQDLDRAAE